MDNFKSRIIATYKDVNGNYIEWRKSCINKVWINFLDGKLGYNQNSTILSYVSDDILIDWLTSNNFKKINNNEYINKLAVCRYLMGRFK